MQTRFKKFSPLEGDQVAPWFFGVLLAAALILVYSNSLSGPFHFDDFNDISGNTSIRQIGHFREIFYLKGRGFSTRPLANLTFALNFALGGLNPLGYHFTNLGIHLAASLTLFGLIVRTFRLPRLKDLYGKQSATLAFVISTLWAMHPLQTESITYVTQRYEALAGWFVFLTIYAVARGTESPRAGGWNGLAVVSCFMAFGSKEVAVSLPILVLLYDRTFLSGSFREAWRRRRGLYLSLLVAWACFLYIQTHPVKRPWAGFGPETFPWWRYALNQSKVILHYLRLCFWPHPLIFDYFWTPAKRISELVPSLILVLSLLGLSAWGIVKNHYWAFLGAFFFFILAPTSSVMPILDMAVEHRMYLPLFPVMALTVLGAFSMFSSLQERRVKAARVIKLLMIPIISLAFAGAGVMTYVRNEDYRNNIDIWLDTVRRVPRNPRAHHNYAYHLVENGQFAEAVTEYRKAIELAPDMPLFRSNFGVLLGKLGRYDESLIQLRRAIVLDPTDASFVLNLGVTLLRKGSLDNAATCFETGLQLNPTLAMPYANLASVAAATGEWEKANTLVNRAIQLDPMFAGYYLQQGEILAALGKEQDSHRAYLKLIELEGQSERLAETGWVLHFMGAESEAVLALRKALQLSPGNISCRIRLAWILSSSPMDADRNGREAVGLIESIPRAQLERSPELLDLYAACLAESGNYEAAVARAKEALALSKDQTESWIPPLEKRLALYDQRRPFRETPKKVKILKIPDSRV